jgi:hypothetical protein
VGKDESLGISRFKPTTLKRHRARARALPKAEDR